MKRFINLFKLDSLVTIRSGFHYVIIGLAVLFIVLVNFVIPESIYTKQEKIIFDGTDSGFVKSLISSSGEDIEVFDDYQEFLQKVESDSSILGIAIDGKYSDLNYEIISSERLSEKAINIIKAAIGLINAEINEKSDLVDVEYAYLEDEPKEIPFNKDLVPIFIALEAVMFGFILIAVLVFQEKDERSLRAYRISPSNTMLYIWSKVIVITILSLFYGLSVIVFTIGFSADYLALLVIILLSSIFITLLGLTLSVFFKNISEFLIVSVLTLGILQLPTISYFNPSFSPYYLRWLPSYPIMFGVRQAMFFPEKGLGHLLPIVIVLLVEIILVQTACYFSVKKRLMAGGVDL